MTQMCGDCGAVSSDGLAHKADCPRLKDRDPLLVEREKTHGDWRNTAAKAQALKETLSFNKLSRLEVHNEALDMAATKLARIICGDHKCKDHWLDLAGYAKLGAEACDER